MLFSPQTENMMYADRLLFGPFRRLLDWRCIALLLALATPMTCKGQEVAPAAAVAPKDSLTAESIDADLTAIELKTDLDDTTKARLVEMLQQAKTTLLRAQSQHEAAQQFEQIIAGAPKRLADVRAKLDAPASSETKIDDALSLTDASQKLASLKAELAAASKQVADLSDESTRRRMRLTEIPGLLTEAEREYGEVVNQQSQPAPANETATESQIRLTLLASRAQETSARIESLQNEQAAYAATADLLPL